MSWPYRDAQQTARRVAAVSLLLLAAPAHATAQPPGGSTLEPRAPLSDVLILESGEHRTGTLQACIGDRCQLDSSPVPLASIVWIGFKEGDRQPPKVEDAASDELHLRDGSVKSGHLLGVSLGVVALQEGSFDRTEVAWLHLGGRAEPPKPTAEPGQEEGDHAEPGATPPASPTPGTTPNPPAPPPAPSPPPRPRPLAVGSGHPRRGHLWTGTIRVHVRVGAGSSTVIDNRSETKVRLREYITLLKRLDTGKVVAAEVLLDPENTEVKGTYRMDSGDENGSTHCKGTGTVTLSWTPGDPHGDQGSFFYVNRTDSDTLPLLGFSVARGEPLYVIGLGTRAGDEIAITCNTHENQGSIDEPNWVDLTSTDEVPYAGAVIGKNPLLPCMVPQGHTCDPEIRTMEGENGRMHGSFHQSWDDDGIRTDFEVRWSICRDDVPCQEAPPEPEHKDPCGDPAQERALMDPIWNQRQLDAKQLAADWKELTDANQAMNDNLEAWRAAMSGCGIEEIVAKALENLSDGMGGEAAELTELLGKMATGDLGYLVPEKYDKILSLLEQDKALVQAALGAGDPQAMAEKLADCPALPSNLRAGAKAFVDAYAEVQSRMPGVQTEVNDIHQLDQQYWDQWQKYYQACLDYAACKKIPSSDCVPPPDQPSGPIQGQQTSAPTGPPSP